MESSSENCTIQGEYIIFEYGLADLWLNFDAVEESHEDYECFDLQIIDKPVIVIHRKYIKTLIISGNIKKKLDFLPTKNFRLQFYNDFDD